MGFCTKCGNKMEEGAKFCMHCGASVADVTQQQTGAYTQNAQQWNAAPYQQPYAQQPGYTGVPPYRFAPGFPGMQTPDYDRCVECAGITDIASLVLLVAAVFIAWFVHAYVGIALCLVAEIVALIPNTKLQNAFKRQNMNPDRNAAKEEEKQLRRELKSRSLPYRLSWILAIIALVCLIVLLILANALGI